MSEKRPTWPPLLRGLTAWEKIFVVASLAVLAVCLALLLWIIALAILATH